MKKNHKKTNEEFTSYEEWEDLETGLGDEYFLIDPGDELHGIFRRIVEGVGPYGSNAYVFTVDGETRFLWGSYALDMALTGCRPGDEVIVIYKGKDPLKDTGRTIKKYIVRRRKRLAREDNQSDVPF